MSRVYDLLRTIAGIVLGLATLVVVMLLAYAISTRSLNSNQAFYSKLAQLVSIGSDHT